MSRRSKVPDYKIGYGRPPEATRFRPGQSGNLSGRPRGSRSAGTIIRDVLDRKITIRDGSRTRKVTVLEAMLLRFADNGLRGDARAFTLLLNVSERYRGDPARTINPGDLPPDDQELIRSFVRRFQGGGEQEGSP